jgi:hypothetical protein
VLIVAVLNDMVGFAVGFTFLELGKFVCPFYIKLDELADDGTVLFCCCERLDSLYGSTKGLGR